MKEDTIGTGMVFYKEARQLGDQAGGEARTQAGKDGELGPDRVWGGNRVASSMGQRDPFPWDGDARGVGGLGDDAKVRLGQVSGCGGHTLQRALKISAKVRSKSE